jgi:hypothetical protein
LAEDYQAIVPLTKNELPDHFERRWSVRGDDGAPEYRQAPMATSVPVWVRIAKGRDGVVRTSLALIVEHGCCLFRDAPQEQKVPSRSAKPRRDSQGLDPMAGIAED